MWKTGGREAEANVFAAELLMPERFIRPAVQGVEPSFAGIGKVAEKLNTSTMATAIQFMEYTQEPAAVVLSGRQGVKWCAKSKGFRYWIPDGEPHEHSAAGEIMAGMIVATDGLVDCPAYAWIRTEGAHVARDADIKEDSRFLPELDAVLSLLWIDDDLEDDQQGWDARSGEV